jgi:hypothetical protein
VALTPLSSGSVEGSRLTWELYKIANRRLFILKDGPTVGDASGSFSTLLES